jgi:hypothetical protein
MMHGVYNIKRLFEMLAIPAARPFAVY